MNFSRFCDDSTHRITPPTPPLRQLANGYQRYDVVETMPVTDWFARAVLTVKDVDASLRFYVDQLGFTSPWQYKEEGKTHVAQVERQGCAFILADTWPDKVGKGLMFISMNIEPHSLAVEKAALDALRAELESKGVTVKDGSWGYRLLVIDDPDGNQLLFNYSN